MRRKRRVCAKGDKREKEEGEVDEEKGEEEEDGGIKMRRYKGKVREEEEKL